MRVEASELTKLVELPDFAKQAFVYAAASVTWGLNRSSYAFSSHRVDLGGIKVGWGGQARHSLLKPGASIAAMLQVAG